LEQENEQHIYWMQELYFIGSLAQEKYLLAQWPLLSAPGGKTGPSVNF
jgi:hypothetical protein